MAKTEADQLDELENAFGEAPESDFDDEDRMKVDNAESQELEGKGKIAPAEEQKQDQWDKDRQEIDQAEANYRKAASELSATKTELESQKASIKALQSKLSDYAKANEVNIDDLDESLLDPTVKKVLMSMQIKLDAANSRAESLEQSRDRITSMLQNQEEESVKQRNRAEILADIETEFPAKYRNDAIQMANKICTDRGLAPADRYEAAKILRGCYKKIAEKTNINAKTDKTASEVVTDTGGASSGVVSTGPEKPVTLREAANQWRQKLRERK